CSSDLVERPRIHARAEQVNLAVRPAGAHLAPPGDRALRLRRPECLELVHRDVVDPRGLWVHNDGNAVIGDRQLDELDAASGAGLDFGAADGPRRVADVDLAAAEFLETSAGAGDADGHAGAGRGFLELLAHGFADGVDRAGPFDGNQRGRLARAASAGSGG